jgi:phosphoribosyl 1,2-cyclic phosphodiesterase
VLRFASLGSGSKGNATLIQSGSTLLLVDCGFAVREMEQRCGDLGISPSSINAVLVTHEHGDHMRGVGAFARRYKVPVWMTQGTWHVADFGELPVCERFNSHGDTFSVGDIEITPVPVPHDAREPSQFIFQHAGRKLGLLTDAGSVTPHMLRSYAEVDALLLECNHDTDMLANGPYPAYLRARVGGDYGHLNNQQAASILRAVNVQRLQHLVAGHLSEKNNAPDLAEAALCSVDPAVRECLTWLRQDQASHWYEIA